MNETCTEQALNFTLAHEIGHILLNHFYTIEHSHDEKEANMFAARLLMPLCVLHECKVESFDKIQQLCNVSKQAAFYRFKRLQLVRPRNKFYTDPLEQKVKNQFNKFIDKQNSNI